MKLVELKKSLLDRMKTVFPEDKYHYYSSAVTEGYKRPCFFTQLIPSESATENFNTLRNKMTFHITHMQKSFDEVLALKLIDSLRELFRLSVPVGDRAVDVVGIDWEFIGTERNIPQISISLEWFDRIEHEETEDRVSNLEINREMEE